MNKNLLVGVTLLGAWVFAASAEPATMNIAVYDLNALMEKSTEFKTVLQAVDEDYKQRFEQLKKEDESFAKSATDFKGKSSLMSASARDGEESKLRLKQRELETRSNALVEEYKIARNKALSRVGTNLENSLGKFAKQEHIDLLLPKAPGIIAGTNKADRTDAVIAFANQEYSLNKGALKTPSVTVAKK